MSFKEKLDKQLEENKGLNESKGNDWFKFIENDNTFRVLTEPVMLFEKFGMGICYTDCGYQGSPKLMTWIFDRKDNRVKLAKLPYTIGEQIISMENDTDYGFTGFPMPYDITIKAIGAGTKEVKYSAPLPRPVKPISEDIMSQLAIKQSCEEIIEKMKKNQKDKHVADGTWQKEQDNKAQLVSELQAARTGTNGIPEGYPTDDIKPEDIPF